MVPRVTLKLKNAISEQSEILIAKPGTYVVGRGPDCDLRLPSQPEYLSVSRHHCLLEIDPPRVRVRDLRSRNGTRINGMQIGHPSHWRWEGIPEPEPLVAYDLHQGDELSVGPAVIEVQSAVPAGKATHSLSRSQPQVAIVWDDEQETRAPSA